MANRLADAISPYLRSHADNPVDWYPWGKDAFAEAARRDVPVLVSIGYSTCHWCHVMARESFSDPLLAEYLNANFVAIKVDREEHPDVDASYLSVAAAFTDNLGWPLNVFVTPRGRAFYAGTYFPPQPAQGHPSLVQVLEAVSDAWTDRRDEVEDNAAKVAEALAAASAAASTPADLPDDRVLDHAVDLLASHEDAEFGGFGGAPKFPVAPVLGFLLGRSRGAALAVRTLQRMAESPLRDPAEGGFFRYATRRDWGEPHYERMLYDNALLLDGYTRAWQRARRAELLVEAARPGEAPPSASASDTATGIADFLIGVLQLPGGGFASGQDSESMIDGARVEGRYYALDADARAQLAPPPLDEKVLTGWNGLAIAALARAGFAFDRPDWIAAARRAADTLLEQHLRPDGSLVRASLGGRTSDARATLEDYGAFAGGLLELALATGEVRYADAARRLIDATLAGSAAEPFTVPAGSDPVLTDQGLAFRVDRSEGAYPSGLTATAAAAHTLYLLTAEARYEQAARSAVRLVAAHALASPIAFGAALALMSELATEPVQLVVVAPDPTAVVNTATSAGTPTSPTSPTARMSASSPASPTSSISPTSPASATSPTSVAAVARTWPGRLVTLMSDAQAARFATSGFELFEGRSSREGLPTAYLCRDFVCKLPTTDPAALLR
ncbi:MAG TPA: DUF255 domain-containing protein [Microbacteriaceae bacterium]|nr:DUF255 domain-containing protein [Microbacteriaceae bacterium]